MDQLAIYDASIMNEAIQKPKRQSKTKNIRIRNKIEGEKKTKKKDGRTKKEDKKDKKTKKKRKENENGNCEEEGEENDKCEGSKKTCNKKKKCRSDSSINQIRVMYVIALILWLIVIYIFKLYKTDGIGWVFLSIPIIIFIINFVNIESCSPENEDEIFGGRFVLFVAVLLSFFTVWTKTESKKEIYKVIFLAVILLTLSLIDVCVPKEHFILVKTYRTILVTASIALLTYALYMYYVKNIS